MEKAYPLISVIVPVYNTEQYLRKCVESIQNQTYPNIEIILVDDESPDGSPQLCDELASSDKRIRVVHQKNNGPGGARNAGFLRAKGQLISYIDSDDTIELCMYEIMYKKMLEHNADIVCCSCVRDYPDSHKEILYPDRVYSGDEAFEILVKNNAAGGSGPCNKLIKRNMIEGVKFPTKVLFEDLQTVYRFYENAEVVVTISDVLYHYFQRENSTTHSFFGTHDMNRVRAEYIRACDIDTRKHDVALYLFDGMANGCMHKCIEIYRLKYKTNAIFDETFRIGYECYNKIDSRMKMSIKRKMIYEFFYKYNRLFMVFVSMFSIIK